MQRAALRINRRQFGAGLISATTLPFIPALARAAVPKRASELSPLVIADLDSKLAIEARKMVRLDRLLSRVEERYFTDHGREAHWDVRARWYGYYGDFIDSAQWFYETDKGDRTDAERGVIEWARKKIPTPEDIKRARWQPIEGLSATFRWREAIFYSALMRYAVAKAAFRFVTFNRFQNPCYPVHEEVTETYRRTWDRLHKVVRGEYSGPWGWPVAKKPADLILLRRVWLVYKNPNDDLERSFLRPALASLRARGVTWIATDDGCGERTWTWVRPTVSGRGRITVRSS